MNESRLERIEDLLAQLIQMVAENNKLTKKLEERSDKMETRFDTLETRFDMFEERFDKERELNRQRHLELVKEVRYQRPEIEYLHKQVAKHDLEIFRLQQAGVDNPI